MRIDSIRHQSSIGSSQLGAAGAGTRGSGRRWASGRSRVAIGSNAAGARRRGLWLRRGGMASKTGTLKQMLLLSRSVLCADLLAIDALH